MLGVLMVKILAYQQDTSIAVIFLVICPTFFSCTLTDYALKRYHIPQRRVIEKRTSREPKQAFATTGAKMKRYPKGG